MVAAECPASGQYEASARKEVKKALMRLSMTTASLTVEGFLNASPAPEIEPRRLAGRRRRALVLSNECARHPFRANLPAYVTKIDVAEVQQPSFWQLTQDDVRGFASVYFAVFAAVLVFIL